MKGGGTHKEVVLTRAQKKETLVFFCVLTNCCLFRTAQPGYHIGLYEHC